MLKKNFPVIPKCTSIKTLLFILKVKNFDLRSIFLIFLPANFKILSLSTYLSVIIGLLGFALNNLHFFTSIIDSLAGLILGYCSLWLINYIYKKIKGTDGIGSGDYLLLGAVGGVFGSSSLGIILLSSSIISIGLHFFTRTIHGERIPLGTGIALSSIIFLVLIILNK